MRTFRLLFLSIFLISCLPVIGQLAPSSNSETAGVSEERLSRFSDFLAKEIKTGKIPGAVSLIARKGEIVHHESFGYSDFDNKTPMMEDDIFHIMSMTKPIVTVGFMMLYEEGHFFLTDPVSKYLPQFKNLKVAKDVKDGKDGPTEAVKSEVTIHQLLTHTAGFSHGLGGSQLDKDVVKALYFEPQASIESRVNTLVGLPLVGHPGEQWYYSASPDVLSLLIEHFSGMSAADFLQQRIFDPLDMKDTGYNIAKESQNRWVSVHNINQEGKLITSKDQLPKDGITVYGGTHGLFSTAKDYLKFCQMLLNGGMSNGVRLLSPKTVELMTMNQVGDLYPTPGEGFGLGFGVTIDVAKSKSLGSKGQYYWGGAFCTYFFIDPEEEIIAILMSQLQPFSSFYGDKLKQMVYQSLTEIEK